ncbi:MAG: hypothetical protein IKE63_02350 [Bacilli bacterium]|nr:hypothetical protein [Bacilli bacterium]
MLDRALKLLNCKEELERSIPIFKKAFVEYYGEEYRQEIEEKFSKAKFIGYQSIDGVERTIREFSMIKTNELIQNIIEKHNLSLIEEELTGNISFENIDIQPINIIINIVEDNELGPEGRLKKSLNECLNLAKEHYPEMTIEDVEEISKTGMLTEKCKKLPKWVQDNLIYYTNPENVESKHDSEFGFRKIVLEKINPEINEENFHEMLKRPEFIKYLDLKEDYQKAYREYKESLELVKKYQDEVDKYEELLIKINKKYHNQFVLNNLDVIPEEKRLQVKDCIENNTDEFRINTYINRVYGSSLTPTLSIGSFCSEFEKALHDPDEPEWKTNQIKDDRIRCFKANGIDLGNNYDDYLNNEEVKKIWPSAERIDELLKSVEHFKKLCDEELYESIERYQKTIKEIEELDLLDKSVQIDKSIYNIGGTFVSPNLRKKGNDYDLFSIVAINFNDITSKYIDHYIVHELNHLFELHLNNVMGNTYDGICGWDTFSEEDNDTKRSYELFNEIINEFIAQEISAIMHRDNVYVFDAENHSSYVRSTSYENTAFLVKEFFEEYKDVIIKSRHNGNVNIILNAVGKDNFEELNSLFKIYEKNFSEYILFKLNFDLKRGQDTELTRIYYDLIDRKDKVLEKMHNYYESHLEKENQL